MPINKCINQTWKDRNPPDDKFRKIWIESWQTENPGWTYRLWDDMEIAAFVRDEFPRFFPIWYSYPQAIMRVDAWRYLLLKKFGGLYVDLDFACLRPLDEWLLVEDHFCVADQGNGELCNAFMWAPSPNLAFLSDIELELKMHSNTGHVLSATGPGFLTHYAKSRETLIERLPTELVYPLPFWAYDECKALGKLPVSDVSMRLPGAGAVTFWSHSWASQSDTKPTMPPRMKSGGGGIPSEDRVLVACLTCEPTHDGDLRWQDEPVAGIDVVRVNFRADGGDPWSNSDIPAERVEALIEDLSMEVNYDWFFICTDHTYVALNRLRDLLDPDWDGVCDSRYQKDGRIDLRAGTLLSKQALDILREIPKTGSRAGFGEVLGQIYADCGILWKSTRMLQRDAFHIPSSGNDLVTAHVSKPQELALIHKVLTSEPQRVVATAHPSWRDKLVFFTGGLYVREKGGGFGTWETFRDDKLRLIWSSGVQEVLVPLPSTDSGATDKGILLSMENAKYLFPIF